MDTGKKSKIQARLEGLIAEAKTQNIDVRTEKLLREVGYRVHSGRCRLKGQVLIILDRDASLGDQVDFLAAELRREKPAAADLTPHSKRP